MSLNLSIERIDKQKSSDGVWCDYGNGARFKLRRIGCPEAVVVRDRIIAELKEGYAGDKDITEADAAEMGKQIIAEAIVADWEGISEFTDVDGEECEVEYPYTPDNAYNMLADDEYIELFVWISEQAGTFENFKRNIRKRDEKKSGS